MKKIVLSLLTLTSAFQFSFSQGTVNPANTAGTVFRTNAVAIGEGSGNIAPTAGGFLFEVLTAPSTVTSVDPALQDLLSGTWSDTGLGMTNTLLATGGRMNGPSGANGVVNFWPAGQRNSFIVVGWSSNLGSTWASIAAQLNGAQFLSENGSYWFLGNRINDFFGNSFIGASTVQQAVSGQATGVGAFSLFGAAGGAAGTPIMGPTDLYLAVSPEPSAVALFGLAGCALIRTRSKRG